MTALITRAAGCRSGRSRRGPRCASRRTRRRGAGRRARASSRRAPRRRRAAGSRRPRRPTARARRGSGGPPRRWWSIRRGSSTVSVRSASSIAAQNASSAWLSALAGRTLCSNAPVPSSNQAPTARVSAIFSQSGLPHECPRWPSPRTRVGLADACRTRGRAARSPPCRPPWRCPCGRRTPRAARAPRSRARRSSSPAARSVQRSSGASVSATSSAGGCSPDSAIAPSGSRPAKATASALADGAPSGAHPGRHAREAVQAGLGVGPRERDRVRVARLRAAGAAPRARPRSPRRVQPVGVDVDRRALDVVGVAHAAVGRRSPCRASRRRA